MILLIFFPPLAAHAAVIGSRQSTETPADLILPPYLFGSLGGPPPLIKHESIKSLQPQLSQQAKRELIRWGPFDIPGMPGPNVRHLFPCSPRILGLLTYNVQDTRDWDGQMSMDPIGHVISQLLHEGLPKDVTVIAGKSDLVYADGTRADLSTGVSSKKSL